MKFIRSPDAGTAGPASCAGGRASRPAAAARDTTTQSFLERRYPGVVRALTLMWGYPELSDFLARVAAGLDPRFHDIEPAAMAELMLLGEIHRSLCPPCTPTSGGWASLARPAQRSVPYRG